MYNQVATSMMLNLLNRQDMQQPRMMYHMSPVIPPATGYCYNYNPALYTYSEHPHNYYYTAANGGGDGFCGGGGDNSAADMFSDENTSSCSVMRDAAFFRLNDGQFAIHQEPKIQLFV
ncbi:hypothetical protein L1887_01100 [Cichorium endivia]|nr:hypothetical protein L1887_01100 [Cichorium endivia]